MMQDYPHVRLLFAFIYFQIAFSSWDFSIISWASFSYCQMVFIMPMSSAVEGDC